MESVMSSRYLLRVEGVNITPFILDSRDLSTIRGASLMLLDAIHWVEKKLEGYSPEPLSVGASAGLFRITCEQPTEVCRQVREGLQRTYPHATFVVDVMPETKPEAYRTDVESLIAANRWRQMQASTLAVPRKNEAAFWRFPTCSIDGVRPAVPEKDFGKPNRKQGDDDDAERYVSRATHDRRKHGRLEKQKFYTGTTGLRDLGTFANDFSEIAPRHDPLRNKIALFYADGNGFGKVQSDHCVTAAKQRAWDTFIRSRREGFLTAFLENEVGSNPAWRNDNDAIAFETLLWGGDELTFVMPAPLGWRFAKLYFESFEGLDLKKAGASLPTQRLTQSAALVFFHHHAPIDRIRRLAQYQLAEFGKEIDRNRDSLAVLALESFDHLGSSYKEAIDQRYAGVVKPEEILLGSQLKGPTLVATIDGIARAIDELRRSESFARSQLRALVLDLIERTPGTSAALDVDLRTDSRRAIVTPIHFRNAKAKDADALKQLQQYFCSDAAMWIQLEELWDYARP